MYGETEVDIRIIVQQRLTVYNARLPSDVLKERSASQMDVGTTESAFPTSPSKISRTTCSSNSSPSRNVLCFSHFPAYPQPRLSPLKIAQSLSSRCPSGERIRSQRPGGPPPPPPFTQTDSPSPSSTTPHSPPRALPTSSPPRQPSPPPSSSPP